MNGLTGTDAPICQDTHSGGFDDVLPIVEVCHDPVVDLAGKEALEAPNDLAFGPTVSSAVENVCPHPAHR